jgi:hypothetical protein
MSLCQEQIRVNVKVKSVQIFKKSDRNLRSYGPTKIRATLHNLLDQDLCSTDLSDNNTSERVYICRLPPACKII